MPIINRGTAILVYKYPFNPNVGVKMIKTRRGCRFFTKLVLTFTVITVIGLGGMSFSSQI